VGFDGSGEQRLNTAPGELGEVFWGPGGHTVLYLRVADRDGGGRQIREIHLDGGQDRLVVEAPGVVAFAPNANASAFVAATGSRLSRHVILLLRIGRQLIIGEHRAAHPDQVVTAFAPDGRAIYYSSDGEGESAVYEMPVDDLVEATDT
jgi:hypothetical protein